MTTPLYVVLAAFGFVFFHTPHGYAFSAEETHALEICNTSATEPLGHYSNHQLPEIVIPYETRDFSYYREQLGLDRNQFMPLELPENGQQFLLDGKHDDDELHSILRLLPAGNSYRLVFRSQDLRKTATTELNRLCSDLKKMSAYRKNLFYQIYEKAAIISNPQAWKAGASVESRMKKTAEEILKICDGRFLEIKKYLTEKEFYFRINQDRSLLTYKMMRQGWFSYHHEWVAYANEDSNFRMLKFEDNPLELVEITQLNNEVNK